MVRNLLPHDRALPKAFCLTPMMGQDQAYYQAGERRLYQEMRQKPTRDTFFSLKAESQTQRPSSVATEFVDTDWDEEIVSEAEDNSPRVSLQSVRKSPRNGSPC